MIWDTSFTNGVVSRPVITGCAFTVYSDYGELYYFVPAYPKSMNPL